MLKWASESEYVFCKIEKVRFFCAEIYIIWTPRPISLPLAAHVRGGNNDTNYPQGSKGTLSHQMLHLGMVLTIVRSSRVHVSVN